MKTLEEAERLADVMLVLEGRMTELVSAVRGMLTNGVLDVQLVQIPANGRQTFDYAVPFASIAIFNHGAAALTYAVGPERETAPVAGVGVQMIGAGRGFVFAATGDVFTLYGTAGSQVSLQVYATPQPPSYA